MFRMWAKIFKNNHMLKDTCIEDGSDDTRTHKVFTLWTKSAISLISVRPSGWI